MLLALACITAGGLGASATRLLPVGQAFERSPQVVLVVAPRWLQLVDLLDGPAMVAAANVDSPGRDPASAWATVGAGAALDGRRSGQPGQGRLGDAIHNAGLRTAIVAPVSDPPSRLAIADGGGRVDLSGVADGPGDLTDQAGRLLRSDAALVLVDAERLEKAGFDALLGRLRGDQVTVLVVAAGDPAGPPRLAPFLVVPPGAAPGGVFSPSTKHVGLVVLTDVAPTALDVLGVDVPTGMTGRALRRVSTATSVAELVRADERSRLRSAVWDPSMAVAALTLVVVAGWAWRWPGTAPTARALLSLLVAGWPLGTWLARAVPGPASASPWAVLIALGLDVTAVALAWMACRARAPAALAVILGATIALVTLDLGVGGPLQLSSAFGSDSSSAGRFYGLGNGAFAAYAGAAAVLVASARRRALWVPALLLLVTLVDALPALGDDLGGALTLGPVFGLTVAALWGGLKGRVVLGLAAATALLVAVAVAIDLSRPAAARTHLARFVAGSGQSATLRRRWEVNVHQYAAQPVLILVVLLALALAVLLVGGRFAGSLPLGSSARIGVGAALGVALVGNVLNDSGAVVTAVVALPLIPYLVIRAGSAVPDRASSPVLAAR